MRKILFSILLLSLTSSLFADEFKYSAVVGIEIEKAFWVNKDIDKYKSWAKSSAKTKCEVNRGGETVGQFSCDWETGDVEKSVACSVVCRTQE